MAKKQKFDLNKAAVQSTRRPDASRVREAAKKKASKPKGWKVVAYSLYLNEAAWVDGIAEQLKKAGNAKANRSLVVREAIHRLKSTLEGKKARAILQDFKDHQAQRKGS